MCLTNPDNMKLLFKNIVYLCYSIKLEEYNNYIRKTLVVFDVIKSLFCDYIKYIELDNKCYFDTVMGLVEEGTDSLYSKCIIKCHIIVRIFINLLAY
jgi:hypothetical protein